MTSQLVSAYKKKGSNVEFILMNYDDNQKAMDSYLVKSKINFPGLKNGERDSNYLSKVFAVKAFPSIAIVDANGKLVTSGVGAQCASVIKKISKLK